MNKMVIEGDCDCEESRVRLIRSLNLFLLYLLYKNTIKTKKRYKKTMFLNPFFRIGSRYQNKCLIILDNIILMLTI